MSTVENKIAAPEPVQGTPEASGQLDDLLTLMARLRADCPWDKKQTNHSLIPYAIEEAYELGEAVQSDDDEDIKGELGDVLLQVVFHCQMYAEQGRFDMAVKERWDEIKMEEQQAREARGKPKRRLDNTKAGSALMQAQDVQKQASKLGFDWEGVAGAFEKLEEEISELKVELTEKSNTAATYDISKANIREIEKELGDCMFALVNVARKLNLDAETATLTCVHKFKSRFGYIEAQLAAAGKRLEDSDINEMDALWEAAKQHECST